MRPIFLVLDPPDPETISTRKLVLETAKFNVLTAFTGEEVLEIAEKIPIQAIVIHERVQDGSSPEMLAQLKKLRPSVPLFVVSPHPHEISNADRVLSSYEPLELVRIAYDMFGMPSGADGFLKEQLERRTNLVRS